MWFLALATVCGLIREGRGDRRRDGRDEEDAGGERCERTEGPTHTNRQTDRQTYSSDRQTVTVTDRHTDRDTETLMETQTHC